MFKRLTKKQQFVRRIFVYIVMVAAVVVIVSGTILFILGYRIDSNKGRLEQGALIQFDSKPNGADVSIDGKSINSNTPSKQSIIAGAHSFTMSRDNYETWTKSLTVKAGTLTWLDYVRLVPKNLKTESVSNYVTIVGEKASPDNKWLLLQEKTDVPSFELVDLRSAQIKSSNIVLPASVYSEVTTPNVQHGFTMQSWDNNGRYVLVKHTYADKSEYIIIDTQNVVASVNVSRLLSISLNDVKFSGTSGNVLYGLSTDGTIRKLDVTAATISRPLVTNVTSFDLYDVTTISYIATDLANPAHQIAGLYRDGDTDPHVLDQITTAGVQLHIALTQYHGNDYVAISEGSKVTLFKGHYPAPSDITNTSLERYAQFTSTAVIDQLTFSTGGDFLIARSSLSFIGYEIEYMRSTASTILAKDNISRPLEWLDTAYIWSVNDGYLSIREFDGANSHVIMPMESGFDATLSQNGRFIYGIAKSADGTYQLQRVQMILN